MFLPFLVLSVFLFPLLCFTYLFVHSFKGALSHPFLLPDFPVFTWSHPHPGVWELALTSGVVLFSRVWLFVTAWTSTPSFPVLHRLPELAQTLVHWVGDAIPPSRPLSAAWKSQICSPLLNSAVSDVSSAAWNWPRWEYLHYGIQQRWQITPSARSQLLNNSSTSLLWPLSEQSLGINNLLLVKITMKEKSLIIQLWKSSAKLHI